MTATGQREHELDAMEPIGDFDAPLRGDGSRPQQVDRDTGLLMWQVTARDMTAARPRRMRDRAAVMSSPP